MPPTFDERVHLSRVAQGLEKADLLIRDGKVINVYSKEILSANIAIAHGRIAYVRPDDLPVGPADENISARGNFLSPGYIEPHAHPWVIYNPESLSKAVLPLGTTTLVMENLVFYQHGGPPAFIKLVKAMESCSSRFYWLTRAVPQSPLRDEEDLFSAHNIETVLGLPQVVGIAEITRWAELLDEKPSLFRKLVSAMEQQKRIDGHTSGCKNGALNALAGLGINSCHEPINSKEVLERLRLGMWVMLRQSSLRPDFHAILPGLLRENISLDRVMMTTDAAEPTFVFKNGFVDGLIKAALEHNLDPVTAIKMATLNPAAYYGLDEDIGGIAPGRYADILFLKDLQNPTPEKVLIGGKAPDSAPGTNTLDWGQLGFASNFIKPSWLDEYSVLAPDRGKVPVIRVVSSGITKLDYIEWSGDSLPEEVYFCALLGRRGEFLITCFVSGFAEDLPALASSFTTSMGVLVMGKSLETMSRAAARLYDLGGGIVLWGESEALFEMPLQIAGMMTPLCLDETAEQLGILFELMGERGFRHNDLLLSLLFLSCDFLPDVKITPMGVLDVKKRKIIYPPKF
ncbi:MAG: adenine deaminase C-terminal domain-containing protein [Bacillota bacterium]|nr:adenine deaminase C-terminal domain-containing protein [Bacillota bacterium]